MLLSPKRLVFSGTPRAKPGPTLIRRCIKIENRKRNQTISIRLTQSEKLAIISKAKKSKLTLTEYILKSSFQSDIKVVDLQPLLVELKRIGNNLNQITRKINSGAFNSYNFSEMIAMQRKIYDAIIKLSEEK
ncbi:MAG: plasmid mobilization protein [Eubacterium sp.]